ncbi:MAG: hypothetical protein NTX59_03385 [Elusimicrobia bacterium]|nr:hypothetical protein [Elusimicrobiota bacterium]
MTALIKLYFRKKLIAIAILVAVLLFSLLFRESLENTLNENLLKLAGFCFHKGILKSLWSIIGIPGSAAMLGASFGAEAASEYSREAELLYPVSGVKRMFAALITVLPVVASMLAIMYLPYRPSLPSYTLYTSLLLQVTIICFAAGLLTKDTLKGALTGVVWIIIVSSPLISASVMRVVMSVVDVNYKYLLSILFTLGAAGSAAALVPLSRAVDRKSAIAKGSVPAALLLLSPFFISMVYTAMTVSEYRKFTQPTSSTGFSWIKSRPYCGPLALAQSPASGSLYAINAEGRRETLFNGGSRGFLSLLTHPFPPPVMPCKYSISRDGTLWVTIENLSVPEDSLDRRDGTAPPDRYRLLSRSPEGKIKIIELGIKHLPYPVDTGDGTVLIYSERGDRFSYARLTPGMEKPLWKTLSENNKEAEKNFKDIRKASGLYAYPGGKGRAIVAMDGKKERTVCVLPGEAGAFGGDNGLFPAFSLNDKRSFLALSKNGKTGSVYLCRAGKAEKLWNSGNDVFTGFTVNPDGSVVITGVGGGINFYALSPDGKPLPPMPESTLTGRPGGAQVLIDIVKTDGKSVWFLDGKALFRLEPDGRRVELARAETDLADKYSSSGYPLKRLHTVVLASGILYAGKDGLMRIDWEGHSSKISE